MTEINDHGLKLCLTNALVISCVLLGAAGCKRMQEPTQSVANTTQVATSQKNLCSKSNQNNEP